MENFDERVRADLALLAPYSTPGHRSRDQRDHGQRSGTSPAVLLSGSGWLWFPPSVLSCSFDVALNSKMNSSRGTCQATTITQRGFPRTFFLTQQSVES